VRGSSTLPRPRGRRFFVALRMLTGDRAKYFGLVFAIAFCTFLLENQTTIFANNHEADGEPDPRCDRRRGVGHGQNSRLWPQNGLTRRRATYSPAVTDVERA
jgi:hypothetical protein